MAGQSLFPASSGSSASTANNSNQNRIATLAGHQYLNSSSYSTPPPVIYSGHISSGGGGGAGAGASYSAPKQTTATVVETAAKELAPTIGTSAPEELKSSSSSKESAPTQQSEKIGELLGSTSGSSQGNVYKLPDGSYLWEGQKWETNPLDTIASAKAQYINAKYANYESPYSTRSIAPIGRPGTQASAPMPAEAGQPNAFANLNGMPNYASFGQLLAPNLQFSSQNGAPYSAWTATITLNGNQYTLSGQIPANHQYNEQLAKDDAVDAAWQSLFNTANSGALTLNTANNAGYISPSAQQQAAQPTNLKPGWYNIDNTGWQYTTNPSSLMQSIGTPGQSISYEYRDIPSTIKPMDVSEPMVISSNTNQNEIEALGINPDSLQSSPSLLLPSTWSTDKAGNLYVNGANPTAQEATQYANALIEYQQALNSYPSASQAQQASATSPASSLMQTNWYQALLNNPLGDVQTANLAATLGIAPNIQYPPTPLQQIISGIQGEVSKLPLAQQAELASLYQGTSQGIKGLLSSVSLPSSQYASSSTPSQARQTSAHPLPYTNSTPLSRQRELGLLDLENRNILNILAWPEIASIYEISPSLARSLYSIIHTGQSDINNFGANANNFLLNTLPNGVNNEITKLYNTPYEPAAPGVAAQLLVNTLQNNPSALPQIFQIVDRLMIPYGEEAAGMLLTSLKDIFTKTPGVAYEAALPAANNAMATIQQLASEGKVPWYAPLIIYEMENLPLQIASGGIAVGGLGMSLPELAALGIGGAAFNTGIGGIYSYLTGQGNGLTTPGIAQNALIGASTSTILAPLFATPEVQNIIAMLGAGQLTQKTISDAIDLGAWSALNTASQYSMAGQSAPLNVLADAFVVGAVLGASLPLGGAVGKELASDIPYLPSIVGNALGRGIVTGGANTAIGLATGSQISPLANFGLGAAFGLMPLVQNIIGLPKTNAPGRVLPEDQAVEALQNGIDTNNPKIVEAYNYADDAIENRKISTVYDNLDALKSQNVNDPKLDLVIKQVNDAITSKDYQQLPQITKTIDNIAKEYNVDKLTDYETDTQNKITQGLLEKLSEDLGTLQQKPDMNEIYAEIITNPELKNIANAINPLVYNGRSLTIGGKPLITYDERGYALPSDLMEALKATGKDDYSNIKALSKANLPSPYLDYLNSLSPSERLSSMFGGENSAYFRNVYDYLENNPEVYNIVRSNQEFGALETALKGQLPFEEHGTLNPDQLKIAKIVSDNGGILSGSGAVKLILPPDAWREIGDLDFITNDKSLVKPLIEKIYELDPENLNIKEEKGIGKGTQFGVVDNNGNKIAEVSYEPNFKGNILNVDGINVVDYKEILADKLEILKNQNKILNLPQAADTELKADKIAKAQQDVNLIKNAEKEFNINNQYSTGRFRSLNLGGPKDVPISAYSQPITEENGFGENPESNIRTQYDLRNYINALKEEIQANPNIKPQLESMQIIEKLAPELAKTETPVLTKKPIWEGGKTNLILEAEDQPEVLSDALKKSLQTDTKGLTTVFGSNSARAQLMGVEPSDVQIIRNLLGIPEKPPIGPGADFDQILTNSQAQYADALQVSAKQWWDINKAFSDYVSSASQEQIEELKKLGYTQQQISDAKAGKPILDLEGLNIMLPNGSHFTDVHYANENPESSYSDADRLYYLGQKLEGNTNAEGINLRSAGDTTITKLSAATTPKTLENIGKITDISQLESYGMTPDRVTQQEYNGVISYLKTLNPDYFNNINFQSPADYRLKDPAKAIEYLKVMDAQNWGGKYEAQINALYDSFKEMGFITPDRAIEIDNIDKQIKSDPFSLKPEDFIAGAADMIRNAKLLTLAKEPIPAEVPMQALQTATTQATPQVNAPQMPQMPQMASVSNPAAQPSPTSLAPLQSAPRPSGAYDPLTSYAQMALYNSMLSTPSPSFNGQLVNSLQTNSAMESYQNYLKNLYMNQLASSLPYSLRSQAMSAFPESGLNNLSGFYGSVPYQNYLYGYSPGSAYSSLASNSSSPYYSNSSNYYQNYLRYLYSLPYSSQYSMAYPYSASLSIPYSAYSSASPSASYMYPYEYSYPYSYSYPYNYKYKYPYSNPYSMSPSAPMLWSKAIEQYKAPKQSPIANYTPSLISLINPEAEKLYESEFSPLSEGILPRPLRNPYMRKAIA